MKHLMLLADASVNVDVNAPTTWGTVIMVVAALLLLASALFSRRVSCWLVAVALILILLMRWLSPGTVDAWLNFVFDQTWVLIVAVFWFVIGAFIAKK